MTKVKASWSPLPQTVYYSPTTLHNGGTLSFQEFQVLIHKACNVINNRPLGVYHGRGECELVPVTPNVLLQTNNLQDVKEDFIKYEDTLGKYTARMRFLETQFTTWWRRWYVFSKWSTKHRKLRAGDIVMVSYDHKYLKPDYRTGCTGSSS